MESMMDAAGQVRRSQSSVARFLCFHSALQVEPGAIPAVEHACDGFVTFEGKEVRGERVGADSLFVRGFFQQELGYGAEEMTAFYERVDREALWTVPTDEDMRYRGNPLQRQKAFLVRGEPFEGYQNTPPDLIAKYGYPGFTYGSMASYRILAASPSVEQLVERISAGMEYQGKAVAVNHVISTKYRTGTDNIGWHSDKVKDIREDTPIFIFSLGGTREFQVGRPSEQDAKKTDLVTAFRVHAGDLFVLGPRTNREMRHAVLPVAQETLTMGAARSGQPVEPRISLVMRDIKTIIQRRVAERHARKTVQRRREREAQRADGNEPQKKRRKPEEGL